VSAGQAARLRRRDDDETYPAAVIGLLLPGPAQHSRRRSDRAEGWRMSASASTAPRAADVRRRPTSLPGLPLPAPGPPAAAPGPFAASGDTDGATGLQAPIRAVPTSFLASRDQNDGRGPSPPSLRPLRAKDAPEGPLVDCALRPRRGWDVPAGCLARRSPTLHTVTHRTGRIGQSCRPDQVAQQSGVAPAEADGAGARPGRSDGSCGANRACHGGAAAAGARRPALGARTGSAALEERLDLRDEACHGLLVVHGWHPGDEVAVAQLQVWR